MTDPERDETTGDLFDFDFGDDGDGGGGRCPYCHQTMPKVYARKLPRADLRSFIELYRQTVQEGREWVHKRFFYRGNKTGGGDLEKLSYGAWGLIETQPNPDDPSKRTSGVWRITQRGRDWMEGRIRIPSHILLGPGNRFDGIPERARMVSIADIGREYDFRFDELMRGSRSAE